MKACTRTNFLKVPHPILIVLGISLAISATIVGIFYIVDSSGMLGMKHSSAVAATPGIFQLDETTGIFKMFGISDAEAKKKDTNRSRGSSELW